MAGTQLMDGVEKEETRLESCDVIIRACCAGLRAKSCPCILV